LWFAQQGRDGSVWSALLENIWAKVNGNYEFIDYRGMGDSYEAFDFLLGVPTKVYVNSGTSMSNNNISPDQNEATP
jgi:hypothetical protein